MGTIPPTRRRRKKPPQTGRPPLESYTDPEQLTPRMKKFCEGLAAGLLPAQVATELKVGVGVVESWLDRCPAVTEYINQLKYEKSLKDEIPFWEEYDQMNREKIRVIHDFVITKFRKEEVPWSIALELVKYTTAMAGLAHTQTSETVEVTEKEELTTRHLLENMRKDIRDPKRLPVELGGKKVLRSVKVTKKEGE